jgi:hypothetical protein
MMKVKLLMLACLPLIIYSLRLNKSSSLSNANDPDLESGFPVQTLASGGVYQGGMAIHTLVGNMDLDPQLEMATTALAGGPLYIWNYDSSLLTGWPTKESWGAAYPAMGNLLGHADHLEMVVGYFGGYLNAYKMDGAILSGWPNSLTVVSPPSLADIDNDGFDEIFLSETYNTHAFHADGTILENWPVSYGGHTPAIADLDQDGDLEIIFSLNEGLLSAFHHNGEMVAGFPLHFSSFTDTHPAIGDIDGDSNLEIVVVQSYTFPTGVAVGIYSIKGTVEKIIPLMPYEEVNYGSAPALADIDGDKIPEIVVQTNDRLHVLNADGTYLPGWPITYSDYKDYWIGSSSPVVGDVDGDQLQDIVITLQVSGGAEGEVRIYNKFGMLHLRFPKYYMLTGGAVPAIADIDLDGRNEIIIAGTDANYSSGFEEHLWVFDLGGTKHGKIEWGQFGGGPHHRGLYPVPAAPNPPYELPPGYHTFLPNIYKPFAPPVDLGIHGVVTHNGNLVGGIPLELRYFDGSTWSTLMNTSTTSNGNFSFLGVPSLSNNHEYYVRTAMNGGLQSALAQWSSRVISNFTVGHTVGISDFDIQDLNLVSPTNNEFVPFPVKFEFSPRGLLVTDMYSLVLYDPVDGNPFIRTGSYRNTSGFIFNELPTGFSYNTTYAWSILIVSPDDALGISSEARLVRFSSSQNPILEFDKNLTLIDNTEILSISPLDMERILYPSP